MTRSPLKRFQRKKLLKAKNFSPKEKKKFQSSFDNSFLEESKSGNQAIDLFLDRANPYNKVSLSFLKTNLRLLSFVTLFCAKETNSHQTAHPALPNVIKELNARHLQRGELALLTHICWLKKVDTEPSLNVFINWR